ncbi:MAG: cyclopropane-fatty-acyl-phospholipid synthase family protein [Alphaproteobacteria bacterium]|nr:cyclopropane-fatty-acyl-phospholipid synthase family protein [Alphaproteobacteria bacterium]
MQIPSAQQATTFPFSPERLLRSYLQPRLGLLKAGTLELTLPNGKAIHHRGSQPGPAASITIKHWSLLRKLFLEGEIGLSRAYVDGDWSTSDLAAVLDFGLHNQETIWAATRGLGAAHVLNRLVHRRNENTCKGSRRNIAAHYDLGNAFYGHWLDGGMTYSSAIFTGETDTLEVAQERKLSRVVELMGMTGNDRVLEIGCGWGGLARRIGSEGAGSVTGISLSREQVEYARASIEGTKLAKKIDFELRDYRSISEPYDRIVSIEMFEAVGERYWPVYFDQLRRSLTKDGNAVLQIITIAEDLFDSYRSRPDFIQQYIFPGGMLPTVGIVKRQAERAGFRIDHHEPFGASYARTLEIWHERFNDAWPQIEKLGFDHRFRRMWNYYLNYCATGFRHGSIDVGLFKLSPVQN